MSKPAELTPLDLEQLGIHLAAPVRYEVLRERPEHTVYRLRSGGRSFILKTFVTQERAKEVRIYALLQELSIPTLPVYASGDSFILIEDLEASPTWRLAETEDMHRAGVGKAVAEWYRQLHKAGKEYLGQASPQPDFLSGWVDLLDEPALITAGRKLGLEGLEAWQRAIQALERLKRFYRSFAQTFNYSDFAAENLAITRAGISPVRTVVFDYDCFTTGTVFSDYRNVVYSLEGAAREAFQLAYGPIDPQEEILDRALSPIEGILTASKRERLPGWAKPLLASVQNGEFANDLDRAIALGEA